MIGKAIYSLLDADATLTAKLGSKIFPDFIPQGTNFPALIYRIVNTDPAYTKSGAATLDEIDIQLEIYHTSYTEAQTIAAACRTALDFYTGTVAGLTIQSISFQDQQSQVFEAEQELVVLAQGYKVRHTR